MQHIASEGNRPLGAAMVARCAYEDKLVVDEFRIGAPLYGDMVECGIGKPVAEASSARLSGTV